MQNNLKELTMAGIVTCNPEIERLRLNIEAILRNGIRKTVLVDNHSNNAEAICSLIADYPGVAIIQNQKNEGIATALNQIFREASDAGSYEWVLTLDQDSVIDDNLIDCYAEQCAAAEKDVVSFTPLRRERQYEVQYRAGKKPTEYANKCATSGNLVKISAWKAIGGFDDRLFIDEVDHDFCYRLREHGYKILRINQPLIFHEIGKGFPVTFLGKRRIVNNHSAFRKYYMVRNRVYLLRKRKLCDDRYSYLFRFIAKTILYEKEDRKNKIHSMMKGLLDGFKMK